MSSPLASLAVSAKQKLWIALTVTPGLGATRTRKLAEHFGSVERVFQASLTEVEAAGVPVESAQSIALGKSLELAEQQLEKVVATGASVLSIEDEHYPQRLREIYDPPVVLFVRGNLQALDEPGIAVVGTRHPTPYGLGMSERLSCDLAARGVIIISGLARGVDTAAHRGSVNARGKTIAVFGTGVDEIYPRENKKLAEQILANGGALISEFPVGTFPAPQNFPIRNRIISGLSIGVLVIEGGEFSGTRITARCALEQNREVFAVPGNVTTKNSWTPNTLIKQGAKLIATWEDVWEELPSHIRLQVEQQHPRESSEPETASLFDQQEMPLHEKRVLGMIKADEAVQIDTLVEKLDGVLSSSELFAALFELELMGKIKQMPGKNFVRSF